ncbi:MAG TPA: hypothetical protein VEJ63_11960 [Planctomycetota bacterium]|nr:hypothetical protein [Planctomycetota bacterium]
MRRRLLIITKDPEFDARGEVVLGQCEPFTSGWRLSIIHTDRRQELLMTGTYTDLRKCQEICGGIDEPEKIKKRIEELKTLLTSNITDTIRVPVASPAETEITKEMKAISIEVTPKSTPGGLLNVESAEGGVLIARLVQPDKAADSKYVKDELTALLDHRPRAVVVDLSSLRSAPQKVVTEIAAVCEKLRATRETDLAICSVSGDTRQALKNQRNGAESLPVYDTSASALAAMK